MRARMSLSVVVAMAVGAVVAAPQAWSAPKTPAAATPEQLALQEADRASRDARANTEEGKFDEALVLAERAVALREKAAPQSSLLTTSYREVAEIHQKAGNYAQAIPPLERALANDEKRG